MRLTLVGGPSVGAVKPCMPGGPPDLGCMGSAPTRGRPGPLVWPDPCPDGCAGGGGGLEKAWLLLALRQRQGWAGGLGMSELWLVVSRRARPDRRAGFAEEDGEVPGAATRSFPAAEVWAWDCVTRESQCAGRRPGAAWGAPGRWPADWMWDQGFCSWLQSLELEFEEAVPGAGEEAGAVSW